MKIRFGRIKFETFTNIRATVKAADILPRDVVVINGQTKAEHFTVMEKNHLDSETVEITYHDGEKVQYEWEHELEVYMEQLP